MKSHTNTSLACIFCGIALIVILNGCAPPKPASLAITDIDRQTYVDEGAVEVVKEIKYPVAILVKENNLEEEYKSAAHSIDSTLTSCISELEFFTIVERSNLDLLNKENMIESIMSEAASEMSVSPSDYLITAKINSINIVEKIIEYKDKKTGSTREETYYAGSVNVDFRFYEKATGKTILTKNIEKNVPRMDERSSAPAKVSSTVSECAKVFAMELGVRYAPPSRVVETRGGGRIVKIAMGSNYGVVKGVKVEFYEYVDNSDIIVGATREPTPIGYGKIIESDHKTAWVEIEKYKESSVKRGHYVRLRSDQSKGLKDALDELRLF